tara:strand:- start:261 stop:1655 length:1395 start_codon:yes stop_codon:yes gene_type:complete
LKSLDFDDFKSLDIDFSKIVNHTLDVIENSILCIDHKDKDKLNKYITSSLNNYPKFIITSTNCDIKNEKVLRFENYDNVFSHILEGISPNYSNLNYFGITGTNGKTTTAFYLNQLIGSDNLFIGTIDEKNKFSFTKEQTLTTPKLFNIVKLISLQRNDINSVSLEVSSHALDQNRLNGLKFLVSGFTNLSQDHLDYHGSIDNYFESKIKLFQKDVSQKFVYIDSPESQKLLNSSNIESFSIGVKENNDVKYHSSNEQNLKFTIDEQEVDCKLNIFGPKYIENFLLAFSMAYYSNLFDINDLIQRSKTLRNPPGRFESISSKNKTVIVDYAHTPVAISEAIKYAQSKFDKVKVILGAGGERDKGKRSKMGEASSIADHIIITNDNPRNEDPVEISKNILNGVPLKKSVDVILDRKEAISKGVQSLKENEVLLVLGKGHEKFQEIENKFLPFDDVKIVEEFMELDK